MKKYIFLKEGETLLPGDEAFDEDFNGGTWRVIGEIEGDESITKMEELTNEYRRPIPLIGENRFLVTLSITVPVQFDCTGMSEEEIDEIASETACRTILANPGEYVMPENVDWENSRIDDEEFQPKYRTLEAGERLLINDLYLSKSGDWELVDVTFNHTISENEVGKFQRKVEPITNPTMNMQQAFRRQTRPLSEGYPPSIEHITI